jgi:hypothetical protein
MNSARRYASGPALRTALEERLKRISREEAVDLQRLRRQVAFDRFLARLFRSPSSDWVLKGGYAMELSSTPSAQRKTSISRSEPHRQERATLCLRICRMLALWTLGTSFQALPGF